MLYERPLSTKSANAHQATIDQIVMEDDAAVGGNATRRSIPPPREYIHAYDDDMVTMRARICTVWNYTLTPQNARPSPAAPSWDAR